MLLDACTLEGRCPSLRLTKGVNMLNTLLRTSGLNISKGKNTIGVAGGTGKETECSL